MPRLWNRTWRSDRNRFKVIEKIPEPPPVLVTEFGIAHYICPCRHKEVVANDANCPFEGRFGNNIIAQTTLLKYEDRLPYRKIQDALKRLHGLNISPATILDLTRRAADAIKSQYCAILNRIRYASICTWMRRRSRSKESCIGSGHLQHLLRPFL